MDTQLCQDPERLLFLTKSPLIVPRGFAVQTPDTTHGVLPGYSPNQRMSVPVKGNLSFSDASDSYENPMSKSLIGGTQRRRTGGLLNLLIVLTVKSDLLTQTPTGASALARQRHDFRVRKTSVGFQTRECTFHFPIQCDAQHRAK